MTMIYMNNLSATEQDATALVKTAYLLADAKDSGDATAMVSALEENLQLWVGIKSLAGKKEHSLPTDVKSNLIRLADFVAQKTFEYGADMPEKTLQTLINSNLQISEGLLEPVQLSPAENDAFALLKSAFDLARAREENDLSALTAALDENLKLWVFIRTIVRRSECELPADTKENLIKLSEFTAQKTFELSQNLNDKTLETLVNNNLYIAEGILAGAELSIAEKEALELVKAAVALSNAKETNDSVAMTQALDDNLQLWVGIKTYAKRKDNPLSVEIKGNLVKLADFVAQKTFEVAQKDMNDRTLDTLINTNLQISEGLLEKKNRRLH